MRKIINILILIIVFAISNKADAQALDPTAFVFNLTNSGNVTVIPGQSSTANIALAPYYTNVNGLISSLTGSIGGSPSGLSISLNPTTGTTPFTSIATFIANTTATLGTFPVTITGKSLTNGYCTTSGEDPNTGFIGSIECFASDQSGGVPDWSCRSNNDLFNEAKSKYLDGTITSNGSCTGVINKCSGSSSWIQPYNQNDNTRKWQCNNSYTTKTSTFNVTVLSPTFDYSLSNGGNRYITPGSSVINPVTATLVGGITSPVTLNISSITNSSGTNVYNQTNGITASFDSNPINPTASSDVTLNASATVPAGVYTVNIGASASISNGTTPTGGYCSKYIDSQENFGSGSEYSIECYIGDSIYPTWGLGNTALGSATNFTATDLCGSNNYTTASVNSSRMNFSCTNLNIINSKYSSSLIRTTPFTLTVDTTNLVLVNGSTLNGGGNANCNTGSVVLTWNITPGVDHYVIYKAIGAGATSTLASVDQPTSGTTVTYTDDNLVPGAYTYYVEGFDKKNNGKVISWSQPQTMIATNDTSKCLVCGLSASPTSISSGDSSTLTWSSFNANSCSVSGTGYSSVNGTGSVKPSATTKYTLTCQNPAQTPSSCTSDATVTVTPARFRLWLNNDSDRTTTTIQQGKSVGLNWDAVKSVVGLQNGFCKGIVKNVTTDANADNITGWYNNSLDDVRDNGNPFNVNIDQSGKYDFQVQCKRRLRAGGSIDTVTSEKATITVTNISIEER